jgi:hypothetical protein
MHDELTEDYRDMIYAETAAEVETRRKAFLRTWRLKCRAVADSLEGEGGPRPRWGRASPLKSYARFWVTRPDQAARVAVSRAATPSVNVTPSMT